MFMYKHSCDFVCEELPKKIQQYAKKTTTFDKALI